MPKHWFLLHSSSTRQPANKETAVDSLNQLKTLQILRFVCWDLLACGHFRRSSCTSNLLNRVHACSGNISHQLQEFLEQIGDKEKVLALSEISKPRRQNNENNLRWYPQQPQRFIFRNLSEACCEAKRWKPCPDLALHQRSPKPSPGPALQPSPDPVEPDSALHQGFLKPSPEPSPEPC